mgnify:CR=1 FL=1
MLLLCREKREEAVEIRQRFLSREGDHITLLNVFRAYHDVAKKEKVSSGLDHSHHGFSRYLSYYSNFAALFHCKLCFCVACEIRKTILKLGSPN